MIPAGVRLAAAPELVAPPSRPDGGGPGELVAAHAAGWLVASCAAGLLMSILLVAPRGGALLGPLTYGRWAALHLDLALYGWLALPLVGALCVAYGVRHEGDGVQWAVGLWSAALAAGAVSWLAGATAGKLFLDWRGAPLGLFVAAQLAVAGVLARAELRRGEVAGRWLRAALWTLLVGVPVTLAVATRGDLYPAVDPASGGPTGSGLVGSTLALVGVLLLVPWLLRRPAAVPRPLRATGWAWALHVAIYLPFATGDRGNDEPGQVALVGSLAVWLWLLPRAWRRFAWPAGSRRWEGATAAWGALVVATGLAQFLPAALARAKFTHLLVAHAHLAMAGFASSFALLVLNALLVESPRRDALAGRRGFLLWQGATVLHVVALFALGGLEAADPASLLRGGGVVESLLGLRTLAGGGMLLAAVGWWSALMRRTA